MKTWTIGRFRLSVFWKYGGLGFQLCKPKAASPYWVFGASVQFYRENRGTSTGP